MLDLDQDRILLSVFRPYGLAKVGYPGFPAVRTERNQPLDDRSLALILDKARQLGVDLVRVAMPDPGSNAYAPRAATVETAIQDLTAWNPDLLHHRILRNVRKAEKQGIHIAENDSSADFLYSLYRQTILAKQGKLRYTRAYFSRLAAAAYTAEWAGIYCARAGDTPIAYVAVLTNGDTAYYLHGASDRRYLSLNAMDLLFFHILQKLALQGVARFNFLSSPGEQKSLIAYKEKWGGTSCVMQHYSIPASRTGQLLARIFRL